MRIVRIIARLNVGGPARHVVWLTEVLSSGEYDSTLIAGTVPPGEDSMDEFAASHGVSPVYIPEMSRELSPGDLISIIKVYRQILRIRPDIVHTHTAKAGTVGRVAAMLYRWLTWRSLIGRPRPVKVVHTFHGHIFQGYYGRVRSWIFLMIERVLARTATDRIVVISGRQLDEISGTFNVGRPDRFAVIPLGIDLAALTPSMNGAARFRDEIGARDGDIVVSYIGRLTEIKNLSLLLEGAELACPETSDRPGMRFAIVGEGHLRKDLESEAARRGLSDVVSFVGGRDDIADILAGTDILAITSLNEGTPLSLIEGLAAGVPFVATDVGGVPDIAGEVVDEMPGFRVCRHGILTREGSAAAFCEGLTYLAKNDELRESMSAAGRAHAAAKYSKDRLINDIRDLYQGLV